MIPVKSPEYDMNNRFYKKLFEEDKLLIFSFNQPSTKEIIFESKNVDILLLLEEAKIKYADMVKFYGKNKRKVMGEIFIEIKLSGGREAFLPYLGSLEFQTFNFSTFDRVLEYFIYDICKDLNKGSLVSMHHKPFIVPLSNNKNYSGVNGLRSLTNISQGTDGNTIKPAVLNLDHKINKAELLLFWSMRLRKLTESKEISISEFSKEDKTYLREFAIACELKAGPLSLLKTPFHEERFIDEVIKKLDTQKVYRPKEIIERYGLYWGAYN